MPWYIPRHGYQENHLPRLQHRFGHVVGIFTGDEALPRSRWEGLGRWSVGESNHDGVVVRRLPSILKIDGRAQLLLRHLRRALEDFHPEIIHLHGPYTLTTLQTVVFPPRGKYIMVVDDHTDGENLRLTSIVTRLRLAVFRRLFLPVMIRRIDKFIAVNLFSLRFLVSQLSISRESVSVLPLGIDDENFYPDRQIRLSIRRKLGVPRESVVIVTSGVLDASKGIQLLLDAFGRLSVTHASARLLVVGSAGQEEMSKIRHRMDSLGISSQVLLPGWANSQHELNQYFNAADIAVIPRKLNSTKEALALGIPLVVPAQDATDYLISGENGFAFEKENHESLCKAMSALVADSELRRRQGANSIRLVRQKLSWQSVAGRSLELYHSLLQALPNQLLPSSNDASME